MENSTTSDMSVPDSALNNSLLLSSAIKTSRSPKPDPDLLALGLGVLQHENAHLRATETVTQRGLDFLTALEDKSKSEEELEEVAKEYQESWEEYMVGLKHQERTPESPKKVRNMVLRASRRRKVAFGERISLVGEEHGVKGEMGEGMVKARAGTRHSLPWTHVLLSALGEKARKSFWAAMIFISRTLIYLGVTYFSGLVIGFTLLVIGEFMIRDGNRLRIAWTILIKPTKAAVGDLMRFLGRLAVFLAVVYMVALQVVTFMFFGIGLHKAIGNGWISTIVRLGNGYGRR